MMKIARRLIAAGVTTAALITAPAALADRSKEEPLQVYRQSYFHLIAANFGPIGAMLKGEMPWDEARLKMFADDLAAISGADVTRAFAPGSEKGTTRAKPGIWENMDDFKSKFGDLQTAAAGLKVAAATGEKAAIGAAAKKLGGACKACHDEYKSKDYLY